MRRIGRGVVTESHVQITLRDMRASLWMRMAAPQWDGMGITLLRLMPTLLIIHMVARREKDISYFSWSCRAQTFDPHFARSGGEPQHKRHLRSEMERHMTDVWSKKGYIIASQGRKSVDNNAIRYQRRHRIVAWR